MKNKKDEIARLEAYVSKLKDKLSDKLTPKKHLTRVLEYKNFLNNEIRLHQNKIDELKVE